MDERADGDPQDSFDVVDDGAQQFHVAGPSDQAGLLSGFANDRVLEGFPGLHASAGQFEGAAAVLAQQNALLAWGRVRRCVRSRTRRASSVFYLSRSTARGIRERDQPIMSQKQLLAYLVACTVPEPWFHLWADTWQRVRQAESRRGSTGDAGQWALKAAEAEQRLRKAGLAPAERFSGARPLGRSGGDGGHAARSAEFATRTSSPVPAAVESAPGTRPDAAIAPGPSLPEKNVRTTVPFGAHNIRELCPTPTPSPLACRRGSGSGAAAARMRCSPVPGAASLTPPGRQAVW